MSLVRADARRLPLADQSVQCCVTSPPYFGLRDYGVPGQIGLEQTPDAYVAQLVAVFREVRRVLADDGVVFLNLGDSYYGAGYSNHANTGGAQRSDGGKQRHVYVPRGAACGTSGKAPGDSQARGCLCESLCDACRAAYRLGKSHSDLPPVPMPGLLPSEPNQECRESSLGHPPTWDCALQADRNEDANTGLARTDYHDAAQPPDVLASTPPGSCLRLQGECLPKDNRAVCRLCGRPFERGVPASCDTANGRGTVGTVQNEPLSDCHICTHRGVSAYQDYTIPPLKPKDLLGIPWRVAFALQADGWYLRSDIIWHKPNPMPESVTDRPTKSHEYLFLLTKSQRYYYDAESIREPVRPWIMDRHDGQTSARRHTTPEDKRPMGVHYMKYPELKGANKRSVWTIQTVPYPSAHFATFPEALVEPCVLAGSRYGDLVLDPFGGTATVVRVARRLGRRGVACELNPAYLQLAKRRIEVTGGLPLEATNAL